MQENWKTLIDPADRLAGPVREYKLSPEELAKYDNIKASGQKPILTAGENEIYERRFNMNSQLRAKAEKLLQEGKSVEEIAKELGYGYRHFKGLMVRWGLIEKATPQEEHIPMSIKESRELKKKAKETKKETEAKASLLKPKVLIGVATEYEMESNALLITDKERSLIITWDKLDTFIQELQEIKQLRAQ